MEDNNKTAADELKELVRGTFSNFIQWLKPNPIDGMLLKIGKMVLKLPIALFMVIISPALIIILGIVFVILL